MVLCLGTSTPQALALRSDLAASAEPQTCNPSGRLRAETSAPAKMALAASAEAQAIQPSGWLRARTSAPVHVALFLGTSAPQALVLRSHLATSAEAQVLQTSGWLRVGPQR
uniref:Uncharacterized protein n=1 Tax=Oryza glumipatula TaxID=40148 RepID=A0A0E0BQQ0_9ORYZ